MEPSTQLSNHFLPSSDLPYLLYLFYLFSLALTIIMLLMLSLFVSPTVSFQILQKQAFHYFVHR